MKFDPRDARNRCDRCGAQAYVAVQLTTAPETKLFFCGHHFGKHKESLESLNPFVVEDHRELLMVP